MVNDLQIRCFLTAADCLSFSESARCLYLSVTTFSRNIAALEKELGVPLFVRTSKSVYLTPEGKLAKARLAELHGSYTQLVQELRDLSHRVSGKLNLWVLDGQMLDSILQTTIMRFERSYPDVKLLLSRETYRSLTDSLRTGETDLIATLAFDVRQRAGIRWETICSLNTLLVMPISHPLAGKSHLRLADFQHDVFIVPSEEDCASCLTGLQASCGSAGFSPRFVVAPDIRTQMLWLEAGRGITAANPHHMMCNSPTLVEAELPEFKPEDFVLAWNEQNENPALVCFLALFRQVRQAAGQQI